MGKSRSTGKSKKDKLETKEAKVQQSRDPKDDTLENPLDFGGLPARSLKKNLGAC